MANQLIYLSVTSFSMSWCSNELATSLFHNLNRKFWCNLERNHHKTVHRSVTSEYICVEGGRGSGKNKNWNIARNILNDILVLLFLKSATLAAKLSRLFKIDHAQYLCVGWMCIVMWKFEKWHIITQIRR